MRPQPGEVINGKYRLVRLLGDGGMGSVFQAEHEKLGITVALKFLHTELAKKSGLVERFLQEARASAQIQSPYVVRVTDVDQTPHGAAFIVLEYLEGKTLQALYEEFQRTGERLSYPEALEAAMQMIDGLAAAHQAGIIHRDLKPDNVMLATTPKGERCVKLLDFGIAKLKVAGEFERVLTKPGVIMGTPEYMAPEQAYSTDGVDSRADIFSIGVILFEMLAGRRPVGGDEPKEIANAYLSGQTAKLTDLVEGISPGLAEAVHKAMSPLAKDRFQTAQELREAIEPFARSAKGTKAAPQAGGSGEKAGALGSAPIMPPVRFEAGPGVTRNEPLSAHSIAQMDAAAAAGSAPVAKTWPPDAEEPPERASSGTAVADGPSPDRPAPTVPGNDAPIAEVPQHRTPGAGSKRRKKRGLSVWTILLVAVGASGAVAAGVFFLSQSGSGERERDNHTNRPDDPGPATVGQPPPPANSPPPAQPPAAPPPPPPPPPRPQGGQRPPAPPAPPGGVPSQQPGRPPIPSALPSSFPSGFPSAMPTAPPSAPPSAPPGLPALPPLVFPPGIPPLPNPFPSPAPQPPQ